MTVAPSVAAVAINDEAENPGSSLTENPTVSADMSRLMAPR
jgi:hypothetical protein